MLVWREKRRDRSPGVARRRLPKQVSNNGKKQPKVSWIFAGQKTHGQFFYVGTQAELKAAIASAGGLVHTVEGEVDVWSLLTLGIANVIGIYGIGNIPKGIASILDAFGVSRFIYYLDNDTAGEKRAARLGTLLHESGWKGEGEYRKFVGPGIAHKGDANDLICHHHSDLATARAALAALPEFLPRIKSKLLHKRLEKLEHDQGRWDAVNEAIRIKLGLGMSDFKPNGGFTKKNFHCVNPQHDGPRCKCRMEQGRQLQMFWLRRRHSILSSRGVAGHRLARLAQTSAEAPFRQQERPGCHPAGNRERAAIL